MSVCAVRLKFHSHGKWSDKAYTYRCHFVPEKGDKLLVPVGEWFGVGRVESVHFDYQYQPTITYRDVIQKLEL